VEEVVRLRVPGDKSITQRALILGALADGESRLTGLLPAADPRSTAGALRSLGVDIPSIPSDGSSIRIKGVGLGGLRGPDEALDLGNSGTGARLLLGLLAGQSFDSVVTGDASLRARPMRRVTGPLEKMGASFRWMDTDGCLPVVVHPGRPLKSVDLDLPVASAQVKSALLLAGLVGRVPVLLTEPGPSRDHTERMLTGAGATVVSHIRGPGRRVELRDPPAELRPLEMSVPGDPSSAAFALLAALLGVGQGEVEVDGVGLNPTRTGVVELFRRMGGTVEMEVTGTEGGEPVGRLAAVRSALWAVEVVAADVVTAIDELPAVAVAAARAEGTTRITGARELRVKETDRIRALVENLRAVGVRCEELSDGLEIEGTDAPLRGRVDSFDDHRIAMVFGVLAAQDRNEIEVLGRESVEVSFPGFWDFLEELKRHG
jgi:3-phosphoshikimate 1-carboxyvinyltransferase